MYGMVLGAEKSWSVSTEINDVFYQSVNALLYENENGLEYLKQLSKLHALVSWSDICKMYFYQCFGDKSELHRDLESNCVDVQKAYLEFIRKLSAEEWVNDEYRQEMLLAAEGICVIAELLAKAEGKVVNRVTDTEEWLEKYSQKWLKKNKESELYKIEEMFIACEKL